MAIKTVQAIINGQSYTIALNGPAMPCQPQGDELDEAVDKLQEECFRYIDGDRAQQKLFAEDGEKE